MTKTTRHLVAPPPVLGETFGGYLARLMEGDYAFTRRISQRINVRHGPLLPTATSSWRAERTRLFESQLLSCLFQDRGVREIFGSEIQDARRQVQSEIRSSFAISA